MHELPWLCTGTLTPGVVENGLAFSGPGSGKLECATELGGGELGVKEGTFPGPEIPLPSPLPGFGAE